MSKLLITFAMVVMLLSGVAAQAVANSFGPSLTVVGNGVTVLPFGTVGKAGVLQFFQAAPCGQKMSISVDGVHLPPEELWWYCRDSGNGNGFWISQEIRLEDAPSGLHTVQVGGTETTVFVSAAPPVWVMRGMQPQTVAAGQAAWIGLDRVFGGEALSFSVEGPEWLAVKDEQLVLTNPSKGVFAVTVTATNPAGMKAKAPFLLQVL